ncbi:MAG: FAD-dependent oxidoreductase [Longimicrobiales bacterium]
MVRAFEEMWHARRGAAASVRLWAAATWDVARWAGRARTRSWRRRGATAQGSVLIVGGGNSGAEIAMELASHHQIWLSGPDTGQEPTRAGSIPDRFFTPIMWLMATRLTVRNPLGRKLRDHFIDPPRGIPLGRVRRKDIVTAGIERVGRTTGVRDGYPLLEDGRVLKASNVIWCTGYKPDFGWLDLPLPTTTHGFPIQDRGIVESLPGLYFVGLLFQYSLSSALLGGVGRDAEYIAAHIASRRATNAEVVESERDQV